MVTDSEPRYRLVDGNGNPVGSVYAEPDGTLKLQEGSGSDNEAVLQPDGTLSVPSVNTEDADVTKLRGYDIDGAEYATLEDAIVAADNGDVIYLNNKKYSGETLTADKHITLKGTGLRDNQGTEFENMDITFNRSVRLEGIQTPLGSNCQFTLTTIRSRVIDCYLLDSTITVQNSEVLLYGLINGTVIFESGTSGGLVDSSTLVSVTDNGTNSVGEI